MNLRDYLHKNRLKCTTFGRLINYDKKYVNNVCNGHMSPGRKFIEAVFKATNGEVTADDFEKQIDNDQKIA